jgi:hypothetical protein
MNTGPSRLDPFGELRSGQNTKNQAMAAHASTSSQAVNSANPSHVDGVKRQFDEPLRFHRVTRARLVCS